ncbi:MAG: MarR family transcriptional regulator, partial [Thermoleophilia bacterium]|nr:MarR family transcriptional regulator [Thermoleophilia bacterium]
MKPEQNNPILLSPSLIAGIPTQPDESPENLGNQTPPIDPEGRLDLRILDSLRRIIRAMEIHSRMLLSTHQVTVHQLVCLLRIKENGPLTETALARMVQLSSSTVVGILTRLEEKGLAKR